MNILNKIFAFWQRFKGGFIRFLPFHFGVLVIASLFICNLHGVVSNDVSINYARGICWGILSGVLVTILCEKYKKGNHLNIVSWIITIIVALLGCWFWTSVGDEKPKYWLWVMLYSSTCIALVSSCISVLMSMSNERTFFSRLFFGALCVYGSVLIFFIGMIVCYWAFYELIAKISQKLIGDIFIFMEF